MARQQKDRVTALKNRLGAAGLSVGWELEAGGQSTPEAPPNKLCKSPLVVQDGAPQASMVSSSPPKPASAPNARPRTPPLHYRLLRTVVRAVVWSYARAWHHLEVRGLENIPEKGPVLALTNHASLLDVPLLMALDPFPNSTLVVKSSLFRLPLVRQILEAWGAIGVDRQGRDLAGLRLMLQALRRGQLVAIAAEGRRTRSGGRLEPVNPVLARLVQTADTPILPIGIAGSWKALPPGAKFPRREKIVVHIGQPFRLPRDLDTESAALLIRARIAALLPPEQQPLDDEAPPSLSQQAPGLAEA